MKTKSKPNPTLITSTRIHPELRKLVKAQAKTRGLKLERVHTEALAAWAGVDPAAYWPLPSA